MNATEIADRVFKRIARKSPYPFLLVYRQHFTSGTLAGITITEDLPFCTRTDATTWVEKINAKEARGQMNYKVTEYAIAPIALPPAPKGCGHTGDPERVCSDCAWLP